MDNLSIEEKFRAIDAFAGYAGTYEGRIDGRRRICLPKPLREIYAERWHLYSKLLGLPASVGNNFYIREVKDKDIFVAVFDRLPSEENASVFRKSSLDTESRFLLPKIEIKGLDIVLLGAGGHIDVAYANSLNT